KVTPAAYPAVVGAPIVKFRFVAFADAGSGDEGWAIDNLRIGGSAPPPASGTIQGKVVTDDNGDGLPGGAETARSGIDLDVKYFGVHLATVTTNGTGDYLYNVLLPGQYTLTPTNVPADESIDYPVNGTPSVNHP